MKARRTILAVVLSLSLMGMPALAYADPTDESTDTPIETEDDVKHNETIKQFNSFQEEVDRIQAEYQNYLQIYEEASTQVTQKEKEIEELKKKIEENQQKLAVYYVQEYKTDQELSIWNSLLSACSFKEFVTTIYYLQCIQRPFEELIQESRELKQQNEEALATLEAARQEAEYALSESTNAKMQIDTKNEELKDMINEMGLGVFTPPPVPANGYTSAMQAALSRLGCPYGWGHKGENNGASFDCSGLTSWAYKQAYGIDIGISTTAQYAQGKKVSLNDLKPGDVLFRENTSDASYQHVAIYLGKFGPYEDAYVHAPSTGRLVEVNHGLDTWTCGLRFID